MLKRFFTISFCLLLSCSLFAQGVKTITGKVIDVESGEPLIGATVIDENTAKGTITDINGDYSIKVEGDKISFSYIGYQSETFDVKESQTLNVKMTSVLHLDELVVVGYTTQKKSSLTGAVAPVNMEDINKRQTLNLSQALQGQISGVQITQSTGAPGDDINVLIRGEGTIGNNSPLYVIDGVPSRSITFLNPNDIENITVLKDASAAAMYGSRAASGVIVIGTKEGAEGKQNVELNYSFGIGRASNLPKMLNAKQYLSLKEQAWNNAGYKGDNPYVGEINRSDIADTDWLDELFTTSTMHNVQGTVSGGNKKSNYLLSAGFITQDGIVKYDNDKYRRLNMRLNLNTNINSLLKVGTNVQLVYSEQDKLNSKGEAPGIIRHAMLRPPVIPVYKNPNDPTYNPNDPFTDLPFYKNNDRNGGWEHEKYEWTSNPIALAKYTDDKRTQYRTFGNVYGQLDLLRDNSLILKSNLGIDMNYFHNKAFYINFGDDDGGGTDEDKGLGRQNRPSSLNEERGRNFTLTWNNTLNYSKQLEKHNINAIIGSEYITNYDSSIGASRQRYDYINDTFRYIDFGRSDLNLWNSGSASEWALMSYFASATYVYDLRYMATLNFRADASSRFSSNNRWGYFPSLSLGWKINEEAFMKDINWISDLKLRGSWGRLGNQEIDNYAFLTLLRKDGEKYVTDRYGNPDLKWETTEQFNIGVDFGLFKNKLYFYADYFKKKTFDILLPISLPSFVGDVKPTIVNAGTVENKGFEFALNYRDQIGKDFKYNLNANISTLRNKVTKLHPNLPIIEGKVTRTTVGEALNSYYGFVMDGIYQNEQEIAEHLHGTTNPSVKPGDIRFADLDGNGVIDDNDRQFLGSPIPKVTYGFTLGAEYKDFSLSLFFHGTGGAKRFNDLKKILDYDTRPFNSTTNTLNGWHGEGTSNSIPRPSFSDNGGSKISSIFVESTSFLRLKNLEFAYSFNRVLEKHRIPVKDMRVFFTVENLFTVTPYSGLDPETVDLIDYGTYPQSRNFIFGTSIKF